jgi:hypothetical protein
MLSTTYNLNTKDECEELIEKYVKWYVFGLAYGTVQAFARKD